MKEGRYSRGYLPHFERPGAAQFITWRLADAVPEPLVQQWKDELTSTVAEEARKRELARKIEKYCDAGNGACQLRKPLIARIMQEGLFTHACEMFELHAWSVMPNHVHVLLTPAAGLRLSKLMQAVKGSSAYAINKAIGSRGSLWQRDFYDTMVRDADHFTRIRRYIEWNPVKAGLVEDPVLFSWSSANEAARKRLQIVLNASTTEVVQTLAD